VAKSAPPATTALLVQVTALAALLQLQPVPEKELKVHPVGNVSPTVVV
jgi:hypothetical protein